MDAGATMGRLGCHAIHATAVPTTMTPRNSGPSAPHAGDAALLARLRGVVGRRHVLTGMRATRRYRQGYRSGGGPVLAVARPGTLLELWQVLQAVVEAGHIVILQAANTGLTG